MGRYGGSDCDTPSRECNAVATETSANVNAADRTTAALGWDCCRVRSVLRANFLFLRGKNGAACACALALLKLRSHAFDSFGAGSYGSFQFALQPHSKCCAVVRGERWLSVEGIAESVCAQIGEGCLLSRGSSCLIRTDLLSDARGT